MFRKCFPSISFLRRAGDAQLFGCHLCISLRTHAAVERLVFPPRPLWNQTINSHRSLSLPSLCSLRSRTREYTNINRHFLRPHKCSLQMIAAIFQCLLTESGDSTQTTISPRSLFWSSLTRETRPKQGARLDHASPHLVTYECLPSLSSYALALSLGVYGQYFAYMCYIR